ncbi:MAG TPA: DUF1833 family protein [Spirochaetota bacterium]|nr:DUF1833 family protein [Spirochaetota bacterium]
MARNTSATFQRAVFAQETDEVFIILLEISHADLAEPIRVCNNSKDIVSNGKTYTAFPFLTATASEHDDQLSTVPLMIDNVGREVVEAIRTITSAPDVTMSVVLASDPDTVEAGPWSYKLRDVRYNAQIVEGQLGHEDILNESYPEGQYDPAGYPALF